MTVRVVRWLGITIGSASAWWITSYAVELP